MENSGKDNTKLEKNIADKRTKSPILYCRFVVSYPKTAFGITLTGNLLIIAITVAMLLSGFDLFPADFDNLPMYDWNVPWRRREWAWKYRDDYEKKYNRKLYLQSSPNWNRSKHYGRGDIVLYYDNGSKNIFTTQNLKRIEYIENNITSLEQYSNYCVQILPLTCAKPASILRFFDGTYAYISHVFYDPHYNNISNVLHAASTNNHTKHYLSVFLAKDSTITQTFAHASFTRTVIPIGYPLKEEEGLKQMEERMQKFLVDTFKPAILKLKSNTSEFDIVYWSYLLFKSDTAEQAVKEITLAAGSLTFIFCFIVYHTKSLWISSFAILSIGTSFLISNLIYRIILDFRYFGFFHIVAIFIILGIGADDLFVLLDVWKNTAYKTYPTLAHRLSHSYRKTVCSMFVTSLTTAIAFFASAFSPLLAARSFGIFAGLLVIINYISVIIFLPPVVLTHHIYFKKYRWPCFIYGKWRCCKSKEKQCADKSKIISVRTPTAGNDRSSSKTVNNDTLKNQLHNSFETGKDACFKIPEYDHVNRGFEMDKDVDSPMFCEDRENIKQIETEKKLTNVERAGDNTESETTSDVNEGATKRSTAIEKKLLVRFFSIYFYRFVTHKLCRWMILAVMVVMIGLFAYSASHLEPDNEQVQFYRSGHNYARAIEFDSRGFKRNLADRHVVVYIAWGLQPRDMSGCHFSDAHCEGEEKYDDSFNPNTPEAQIALMKFCDTLTNFTLEDIDDFSIRRDTETGHPEIRCFMDDLRNFIQRESMETGIDWSLPWDYNKTMSFLKYRPLLYDTSKINQTFPNILEIPISYWLNDGYRFENTTDFHNYHSLIGEALGPFSTPLLTDYSVYFGNKIRYIGVEVNLTLGRFSTGYKNGKPVMDRWEEFVSSHIRRMPPGLQKGFQLTKTYWHTLSVQKTMANNAIFGITLGILCALPILILATQNIIVGVFATLSMCCCTVCVIGIIPLAGWKLGLLESLNMCMVVGLSVDYVVHLAEGYHMSAHADRMSRVRDMLEEVGISVFSGACTTLGAAVFLLFAQIQFLIKFGIFLLCTTGFSLIFSLGCFTTIMGMFGPTGKTGDIREIFRRLTGSKREDHTAEQNQGKSVVYKTRF